MKFIRKILVKLLGLKGYLRLVSRTYIGLISMGFMRKKYPELFFLKQIIKPGDTVVDIGANLSYYSYFMSKAVGKAGKIFAVEPVPLFAEVWNTNMRRLAHKNYHLSSCALGQEAKEHVKMSIPIVNGVIRHGLTKVVDAGDVQSQAALSFEVPMKNGDGLVTELNIVGVNFIKCDVEGFEQYVIPSLESTIQRDLPILQVELTGTENRQRVVDFLVNLSYRVYILNHEYLVYIEIKDIFSVNQDFYFLPESRLEQLNHLIKK